MKMDSPGLLFDLSWRLRVFWPPSCEGSYHQVVLSPLPRLLLQGRSRSGFFPALFETDQALTFPSIPISNGRDTRPATETENLPHAVTVMRTPSVYRCLLMLIASGTGRVHVSLSSRAFPPLPRWVIFAAKAFLHSLVIPPDLRPRFSVAPDLTPRFSLFQGFVAKRLGM